MLLAPELAPHEAAVLTVRSFGSQIFAVVTPGFCVELAAPTGQRLNFRAQNGSVLKLPHGMGPRDEPSQVLQPIAHPLLNPALPRAGSEVSRWNKRAHQQGLIWHVAQ